MTSISRKLSTPDSTDTPLSIKLASAPATDTTNVLAQFAFGGHSPGSIAHNGLTPLAGGPVYEIWRASGTSVNGHEHGVDWRAIGPLLFGSITMAMGKDAEVATRQLYQHILDCKRDNKGCV